MDIPTMIEYVKLAAPILSALVGGLITFRIMRKKMNADANKSNAEAAGVIVGVSLKMVEAMEVSIKTHEEEIKKLREELNELKDREEIHNEEREQLRKKIKDLEDENSKLRGTNRTSCLKIKQLEKEISKLKTQLKKYVNTA